MQTTIKNVLRYVYHLCISMIYYIFRIFPIRKNKVVIVSYYGQGFGDNAKAIANEMHRQLPELEIVWLVNNINEIFPEWIRPVQYGSLHSIYELVTAKFWIDNARKRRYVRKRPQQYYIQTWHGSIALKRVEKDVKDELPGYYVDSAINDSKMADLFLSNSKWCTEMYRRAFWYDGEVLECGSPRCDRFFVADKSATPVHDFYSVSPEVRLLLYAPTFRKIYKDCYNIDFNRLHEALVNKFRSEVKIIVRLHPNVTDVNYGIEYNDHVLNGTAYPDMYELLSECDMMINDYSSSMFEFALLKKPVWLYATDIETYTQDRGFYFDLKNLPFPLAQTNEELLALIDSFDSDQYQHDLAGFMKGLGVCENGGASSAVVDRLAEIYKDSI